jgi:hypothetical protein
VPVVGDKQVEDHGNIIAEPFVAQLSLIGAAMPGIIEEVFTRRIAFYRLDGAKTQITPYFDIVKLVPAGSQRPVQKIREAYIRRIVHPVAALDDADSLLGSSLFAVVLSKEIHVNHIASFPPFQPC